MHIATRTQRTVRPNWTFAGHVKQPRELLQSALVFDSIRIMLRPNRLHLLVLNITALERRKALGTTLEIGERSNFIV